MHDHATPTFRGLLRILALSSALGVAAPAKAFDRGHGGDCCCDDGRYDSVGFGAAGIGGGSGFGGPAGSAARARPAMVAPTANR